MRTSHRPTGSHGRLRRIPPLGTTLAGAALVSALGCATPPDPPPATPPDALAEAAIAAVMAMDTPYIPPALVEPRLASSDGRFPSTAEGFVDVPWQDAWRSRIRDAGWTEGDFPKAYSCNSIFGPTVRIFRRGEEPPPLDPEALAWVERCTDPAARFTLVATSPVPAEEGDAFRMWVLGVGDGYSFSAIAAVGPDAAVQDLRVVFHAVQ